jgi:hypothetical protein
VATEQQVERASRFRIADLGGGARGSFPVGRRVALRLFDEAEAAEDAEGVRVGGDPRVAGCKQKRIASFRRGRPIRFATAADSRTFAARCSGFIPPPAITSAISASERRRIASGDVPIAVFSARNVAMRRASSTRYAAFSRSTISNGSVISTARSPYTS